MNLEQLANLGELIGGLAVVASLIYLAIQIRQNTQTVRSATLASNTDIWSNMLTLIASSDLTDAYLLGSSGKQELTPKQLLQFFLICRALFVSFENQYYQFTVGTFDEDTYLGYERSFKNQILIFPGFQAYWRQTRAEFSPKFIARMDGLLTEVPEVDALALMKRWQEVTDPACDART